MLILFCCSFAGIIIVKEEYPMKNSTGFKLLVLILTLSMLLSLISCGTVEEETSGSESGTEAEETAVGGDTTDKADDTEEDTSAESDTDNGAGTDTDTATATDTDDGTESDTDSDETTEKKDDETTEAEETTTKKEEVAEDKDPPTPFDGFWGPVFFKSNYDTEGVEKSTLKDEEGGFEYTHFDVKKTQQDSHVYLKDFPIAARYLFIKFRTNSNSNFEIYTTTELGGASSTNNKVVSYKNNGEWQILALDLTESHPKAVIEKNGKYTLRFMRLDLVNSTAAGKYMDIAYVALCDDLADYKKFIGDEPCDHLIKTAVEFKEGVGYVATCRICGEYAGTATPFKVCYTNKLNAGWKNDLISETTADGVKITVAKEGGISAYESTVGFSGGNVGAGLGRYVVVKYRASDDYSGSFEIFANDIAEDAHVASSTGKVELKTAEGDPLFVAYKLNPDSAANGAGRYLDSKGKGTDDVSKAATVNTAVDEDMQPLVANCELKAIKGDLVPATAYRGPASTGTINAIKPDGEWHIFVIDLDAAIVPRLISNGYAPDDHYVDPITPAADGNCSIKFLRIDLINGASAPKGAWIEYAYIGFANSVDDIKAVVTVKEEDCIHGVYSEEYTSDESTHSRSCLFCGKTVTEAHVANGAYTEGGAKDTETHEEKCTVCGYKMSINHTAGAMTWNGTNAYETNCTVCLGNMASQLFPKTFDKNYLAEKLTVSGTTEEITADGIRFTVGDNGAGGDAAGRLAYSPLAAGRYMIVKYKNNNCQDSIQIIVRYSNQAAYKSVNIDLVSDGGARWHTQVVDLEKMFADETYVKSDEDGNCNYYEIIFDLFDKPSTSGEWLELAYVAFNNDLDHVVKAVCDELDVDADSCNHHSSMRSDELYHEGGDKHWNLCLICGNKVDETSHAAKEGEIATPDDNGNTHSVKCACGYQMADACSVSGARVFDEGSSKYKGKCTCGREWLSSFLYEVDVQSITIYSTDTSKITFSKEEVKAEGDEPAHVHFTANASASGIDGYTGNIVKNNTAPTGQYLVIKMRTNKPHVQIWSDTTGQGTAYAVVHPSSAIWSGTKWTVVVFDLSKISAYGAVDGVYTAKNLRIDLFNNDANTSSFFDIAYMGFVDNLEAVEAGYKLAN